MRSSPNNCHCVETGHNGQSGQQTGKTYSHKKQIAVKKDQNKI